MIENIIIEFQIQKQKNELVIKSKIRIYVALPIDT